MRSSLWLTVPIMALVLVGAGQGYAFQIEGTGDFEIQWSDMSLDDYSVVCLAGFDLVPSRAEGEVNLLVFAEFGPFDVVSGSSNRAGQVWLEIPGRHLVRGRQVLIAAEQMEDARYSEWNEEQDTLFDGQAVDGWIEITADWEGDDLIAVDSRGWLLFEADEGMLTRTLEGMFFGGASYDVIPALDQPSYPARRRVERVHHGCSGEYYTVVYDDPYYAYPYPYTYPVEDDNGCEGDSVQSGEGYYDDTGESGCEGDTLDDGGSGDDGGCEGNDSGDPEYGSDDTSCSGDDSSGSSGSSSDTSSDIECAGDDLNSASLVGSHRPGPPRGSERLTRTIMRNIHLWLPLAVILAWRRRERRE